MNLRDKKFLIIAIAVLAIVGGAIFYFLSGNKSSSPRIASLEEETAIKISPEEIGLSLVSAQGGRIVILRIEKTQDLRKIEYELSYTALPSAAEKGEGFEGNEVQRGVIGELEVNYPGEPVEQEIILGTCSDVCHYDQGVTSVNLAAKVTKKDGKVYQVEASLEL